MCRQDVRDLLRDEKRRTESIDDQVAIAHAMWDGDIDQAHDGIKASDLEDELSLDLDYDVRTSLGHLEDVGLVEEYMPPGVGTFAIAEWLDGGDGDIVNGEVEETAREGLEGLRNDLEPVSDADGESAAADGSGTIVDVVATEFDLLSEGVDEFLRTTDDPVDVLNDAVDAIEDVGLETNDDYGKIVFVNRAYRYRLTEAAVEVYER